ncbi:MAG TPA: hypothetical protein VGO00_10045 [Kofleriaceae bacterium]|nr:hypothetical protein [Kofleriaceae bacterium]
MARQRRGGFRPPELRGTLGTLLRTTLAQAGTLREALERGAREGRSRLDEARQHRRRQDAVAELGEIVLQLIRDGEIDLDELPEVRQLVAQLDEVDADDAVDEDLPRAPIRRRFDDRETRDLKPPREDGTVSSSAWKTKRGVPQRVWRPVADEPVTEPDTPRTRNRDDTSTRSKTRSMVVPKKGGINFDDNDEDLADYMHPDDVPPKPDPDDNK